jgi:3-isopropylmalate dehydratase small subunit
MEPFTRLSGVAVPMPEDNVNTDEISPIQLARKLQPDYRAMLFMRSRWQADGTPVPGFVLNRPQFQGAAILVAGENFGCGSSREAAVWALMANGIRCLVAPSFADMFRENCLKNGVLPVTLPAASYAAFLDSVTTVDGAAPFTVDLESRTLSGPDGTITFDISPADRLRLLEGLDDIGLTLKHLAEIEAWERRTRDEAPWYQTARDRRRAAG